MGDGNSLAAKFGDDLGSAGVENADDIEVLEREDNSDESFIPTLEQKKVIGVSVEVRPIEKIQWHGKKGKESFTQAKTIECLFNKNTGAYDTGLTEDEAAEYGKRMGVELSNTFNYDREHPYWSSKAAQIKLENHTMFFDTSIPSQWVKVKNMRASKYVANSFQEYLDGKWPDATHVIYDEQEQVTIKANKIAKRRQADTYIRKMSADDKINVLLLLSKKTVKKRSADYIEVELDEVVNENIDEFLSVMDLGRAQVEVRGKLTDAINRDILTKEGNNIFYMGDMIAMDFEDLIKWFMSPQNSITKARILDKLSQNM